MTEVKSPRHRSGFSHQHGFVGEFRHVVAPVYRRIISITVNGYTVPLNTRSMGTSPYCVKELVTQIIGHRLIACFPGDAMALTGRVKLHESR